jgi:excisionase family DNA binding protein
MSQKTSLSTLDEKRALRVKDASALYGLSRSTLYVLMDAGKLRSVKIGGRRLIPRDALESLLNSAENAVAPSNDRQNHRERV